MSIYTIKMYLLRNGFFWPIRIANETTLFNVMTMRFLHFNE